MELILLKDIEKVGHKGDVVRVRDGFARNFLLPRKWALPSTRANREFFDEQKERMARRREKEKMKAQDLAAKLGQMKLTIPAQAGEQDKLYGSVTAEDICEALNKQGHAFNRKQILLKESIRALGTHAVMVELFSQVKASLTVEVIRKS